MNLLNVYWYIDIDLKFNKRAQSNDLPNRDRITYYSRDVLCVHLNKLIYLVERAFHLTLWMAIDFYFQLNYLHSSQCDVAFRVTPLHFLHRYRKKRSQLSFNPKQLKVTWKPKFNISCALPALFVNTGVICMCSTVHVTWHWNHSV